MLRAMAAHTGQWAGIPLAIEGERLTVHPSYPWAHIFNNKKPLEAGEDGAVKIRNAFWSRRWRCEIAIYEEDGKVRHYKIPTKSLDMEVKTLGCSFAWGIEQEHNALKTLGTLVKHHTFKQYLLTGTFFETSKRTGITYFFRKLRPTVALRQDDDGMRILCALCMHPIAHYEESWAGAMCPTDDVIAHLMLMRADEPLYWRRSNQHPPWLPQAGV